MSDFYPPNFVGGPDGTQNPPKKLDQRLVGGKERYVEARFKTGTALASGDRLYLGKLPAGAHLITVSVISDTTLGTTTLSVGTTAAPTKYVNAKTMTTVDTPTGIGPKASAAVLDPVSTDEELWLTLGVGGIGSAIIGAIRWAYTINT